MNNTDSIGIAAAGYYLPQYTRSTRRGSLSIGNGDEDALTFAVEASAECLRSWAGKPPTGLFVAFGGPPLEEGPLLEVLREAIGLPGSAAVTMFSGGALSGLAALRSAGDAVRSGRHAAVLVVASEYSATTANGAVAVLVSNAPASDTLRLRDLGEHGEVLYDSWRPIGASKRHVGDNRHIAYRFEKSLELLEAKNAVPGVLASASEARNIDVPAMGVAEPLLVALEAHAQDPGRPALVAAAANGRTVVFEVSGPGFIPAGIPRLEIPPATTRKPEPIATPVLSLPPGSPFFSRSAAELLRLEGVVCDGCGAARFPASQRPICAQCGSTKSTRRPMARNGVIYTFTKNRFLPNGFGDQMVLVLAEMDDGNRYWAPTSGMDADEVEIGVAVRLVLRRFTQQDGIPAYAMKFVRAGSVPAPVQTPR